MIKRALYFFLVLSPFIVSGDSLDIISNRVESVYSDVNEISNKLAKASSDMRDAGAGDVDYTTVLNTIYTDIHQIMSDIHRARGTQLGENVYDIRSTLSSFRSIDVPKILTAINQNYFALSNIDVNLSYIYQNLINDVVPVIQNIELLLWDIDGVLNLLLSNVETIDANVSEILLAISSALATNINVNINGGTQDVYVTGWGGDGGDGGVLSGEVIATIMNKQLNVSDTNNVVVNWASFTSLDWVISAIGATDWDDDFFSMDTDTKIFSNESFQQNVGEGFNYSFEWFKSLLEGQKRMLILMRGTGPSEEDVEDEVHDLGEDGLLAISSHEQEISDKFDRFVEVTDWLDDKHTAIARFQREYLDHFSGGKSRSLGETKIHISGFQFLGTDIETLDIAVDFTQDGNRFIELVRSTSIFMWSFIGFGILIGAFYTVVRFCAYWVKIYVAQSSNKGR